ncbi:MAG: hypothetical protein CMJ94_00375 [Planctomycetes bacterium]|nr:hypothetical protein [Planctomycetota bacterium]
MTKSSSAISWPSVYLVLWSLVCGWSVTRIWIWILPLGIITLLAGMAFLVRRLDGMGKGMGAMVSLAFLLGVSFGLGVTVDGRALIPRLGARGTLYPDRTVLLAEVETYGYFSYWADVDPGAVVELPRLRCDLPTVVSAVNRTDVCATGVPGMCGTGGPVYISEARLTPRPGAEFRGNAQVLCLDRIKPNERSAMVLYVEQGILRTMLRTAPLPQVRDVALAAAFPGFSAMDVTKVPGHPSQFALWGSDANGELRILRFDLRHAASDDLRELLIEDRRHPGHGPARAVAASSDFPDQAWYLEDESGDLFHYRFSKDQVNRLRTSAGYPALREVRQLEVEWLFFHDPGDDIPLKGSDRLVDQGYAYLHSPVPHLAASINLNGAGDAVESVYARWIPPTVDDD